MRISRTALLCCARREIANRRASVAPVIFLEREFILADRENSVEVRDKLRRRILFWIPAAVFASVSATLAAAAFRFLRPREQTGAARDQPSGWTQVAPLTELQGTRVVGRTVPIEQRAGWSVTFKNRMVFILPPQNNLVLSAVCPHEGCDVEWLDSRGEFICPCHDSRFAADGTLLTGPAKSGLTKIPARVVEGVLEIQPPVDAPIAMLPETRGRG